MTPEVTKIDDPADPASKYLTQTAVQSPDAEDVYNGNVTTNARGFATVRLPDYFDAENIDPRYQLTPVGAKGWDARVGVWKQEAGNQFVIRSTIAGIEVSWQLTATRNDPASRALRAPAEQLKPAADQGKYLDPTAYGKPASAAIGTEQPGMKKPGVVKELAPARTKVPASIKSRSAQARQQIAKPAPLPPAPATPQVR
jgi:hypothetical protein